MTFNYAPCSPSDKAVIRLLQVIDGDGKTNTISYVTSNSYSTNLISQVVDPYGRTNFLSYDASGNLTNITDTFGLSSSCKYGLLGSLTNLITPYGTTTFQVADQMSTNTPSDGRGRSILVTRPDGSRELFLYTNSAAGVPSSYSTNEIPSVSPYSQTFDTNSLNARTSFHWGPRQYANLSTTNMASFTANDFRLARMIHWLKASDTTISSSMSLVRDPSPDVSGSTEGQKTWYDYAGKTNIAYQGTQSYPLFEATVLPDGSSRFSRDDRNSYGNSTTNVSTFTSGTAVALRTNVLVYATNDIDVILATNALSVRVISNAFNTAHEVLTNFNALNERTLYSYDSSNRLSSITAPSGLVVTNIYGTDGYLAEQRTIGYSTNTFTYANALLSTYTDARGLTTTYSWDNLNRLTGMSFPDSTSISNQYTVLDVTGTKDRLGNWTYYGYNSLRQLITVTNRNGNYMTYDRCPCGAIDTIHDFLGKTNHYNYDNQMRVTNVVSQDGYSFTNYYDLLGRVTTTVDGAGSSTTNVFNNQGFLIASSNSFGLIQSASYDILDRVISSTNANGVTISTTYDNLDRVLSRTYPDSGVETWGYTANIAGATSYTNQLTNIVTYGYDSLARLTSQINVGIRTNQFFYDGAGDLTNLIDGNAHSTIWGYDTFGRNTSKVDATSTTILTNGFDANNRLTSRWSAAKGRTTYSYDYEGNLLTVTYPVSTGLTFAYDAMNRLTNMTDTVGTSAFTYTDAGQLLSEDGPWSNDTVSYTYTNRLRSSLSLQHPTGSPWSQTYAYDAARRLTNITTADGSYTYSYDPTRHLKTRTLTFPNTAYVTNAYDNVSRLTDTWLKNSSGTILDYHGYAINVGNQRYRHTAFNNNYTDYTYDNAGQLINASGKESGGTPLRYNEQLGYKYDPAGNLQFRTNNTLIQNFVVNSLNELSNITSSGAITVEGNTSTPASSVTVNGTNAALYSDATFAATNMPLANSYTAVAQDVYGRADTNTITLNLSTKAALIYDANGNLTYDGLKSYDYDDENQLIRITVTNSWKSEFTYDALLRRRKRIECTWTSGSWTTNQEVHYVYDGNLQIEERDGNNSPTTTYTRGRDLSGNLQRAGGIGGLLGRTTSATSAFYFSDGNGNVTMLVGTNQIAAAKYVYDAFGNTLSLSGPLGQTNIIRFSSKELHSESGLIFYGYRYYESASQRWLNKDPMAEQGGLNLYTYVANEPINDVDPLGLLVVITSTSGNVGNVWTVQQFINQVQAQPNGTISDINFVGHANSMVQGISDDNTVVEALWLQNGVPVLNGVSTRNSNVLIENLLKYKMVHGGHINLDGCHAAGPNMQNPNQPNLPEALSRVLPGIYITGSTWSTLMSNPPDQNGNTHMPFTVNTYYTSPTANALAPLNTRQNSPTIFKP